MTPDTAMYILSAALLPALAWATHITIRIISLSSKIDDLLETQITFREVIRDTNKAIESNTRAMVALTHYIKWVSAERGLHPPPPLENITKDR